MVGVYLLNFLVVVGGRNCSGYFGYSRIAPRQGRGKVWGAIGDVSMQLTPSAPNYVERGTYVFGSERAKVTSGNVGRLLPMTFLRDNLAIKLKLVGGMGKPTNYVTI
jgi:hypothetical protein